MVCAFKDGFQISGFFRIAARCHTFDGFINRIFAQNRRINQSALVRYIAVFQLENTELKLQFGIFLSIRNAVG